MRGHVEILCADILYWTYQCIVFECSVTVPGVANTISKKLFFIFTCELTDYSTLDAQGILEIPQRWTKPEVFNSFISSAWWRQQMETISALLDIYEGNPPVTDGFPSHRPVTRSFDVFFEKKPRLSKQSRQMWFDTSSRSLWCHCNGSTWLI